MAPVRKSTLKCTRPRLDTDNASTHTLTPSNNTNSSTASTSSANKCRAQYRTNSTAQNLQNVPHDVHFAELWSIWNLDQRLPTIASRNAWALARNIDAGPVHRWFSRRRCALRKKKLKGGVNISDETYELPVGTPPTIAMGKDEEMASISYLPVKLEEDDSSDQDATSVRSSPPSTLFDSDPVTPSESAPISPDTAPSSPTHARSPEIPEEGAYTLKKTRLHKTTYVEPIYLSRPASCLKRTAVDSSTSLFIPDPSQPLCNQGRQSSTSDFTCLLCTSQPEEHDTADDEIYIFDSDPRLHEFSYNTLPYHPNTLMELSAIPFISRSPDFIPTPTLHSLTSWLQAFNSGYAYNDALGVYSASDTNDGFWLGPEDDNLQPLAPIVDSIGGEPFDFLPPLAETVDYENLPIPTLCLSH